MPDSNASIAALVEKHQQALVKDWLAAQKRDGRSRDAGNDAATADLARQFLEQLRRGAAGGQFDDITGPDWASMREVLEDFSRSRATQGFTPSETAVFVFSLKEPLFDMLRREVGADADQLARATLDVTARAGSARALHHRMLRSGPAKRSSAASSRNCSSCRRRSCKLWDGILALPLIGTLDSARTQIVMENLLQRIVDTGAEIAIIDITGVPTVDTLVAQHLIKTVAAARLMGADCIISGIRPQIAQTIVHLGVELAT